MPCSATCSVKKWGVTRFPTGRPCMSGKASTTVSMDPSAIPAVSISSPMTNDAGPGRLASNPLYARCVHADRTSGGRVLVAKVGLDGHDRGVKVVARMLRDAGYEVIYLGLRQSPVTVANAAVQEDVDLVGLSMHSGGHLTLAPAVIEELRSRGLDTPVVVGGIIPERDVEALKAAGVVAVLSPGASKDEVI